jgi:SAM-dependent methyltransferase
MYDAAIAGTDAGPLSDRDQQTMTRRLTPSEIAANYDLIEGRFRRSETAGLDYLDRFCSLLTPRGRILDIGCGTGVPITKRLVERQFSVHALDISANMLAAAKRNAHATAFHHADIMTWVPTSRYDGVVAWDSIFHLTVDNQRMALEKILRMLRHQGVALITCGVHEGELISSMFNCEFYYSSPSLLRYLEMIEAFHCNIRFMEIDDGTGDGHAVICFQKTS